MTEKKQIGILAILIVFTGLLCVFFGIRSGKSTPERITSAILNTKYRDIVTKVEVSRYGEVLTLYKDASLRGIWLGYSDSDPELVFPVDPGFMEEFLSNSSEVRDFVLITKNPDDKKLESFNLLNSSEVTFNYIADDTSVSLVTFGSNNYSGQKIYVTTPDSPVYEIHDDFFPWLTTAGKSWANMNFVPKNIMGITDASDIQRITVSSKVTGKGKNLTKATEVTEVAAVAEGELFKEIAEKVLSLRGGALINPSVTEGLSEVLELRLEAGNTNSITLKVYPYKDSFVVVPTVFLNTVTEGYGLNYGFEISTWTYNTMAQWVE